MAYLGTRQGENSWLWVLDWILETTGKGGKSSGCSSDKSLNKKSDPNCRELLCEDWPLGALATGGYLGQNSEPVSKAQSCGLQRKRKTWKDSGPSQALCMTNEGTRKDLQLSRAVIIAAMKGERGHSQDFTGVLSKKSKREMTKTSVGSQLRLANAPNLLPALSHRCHSMWSQRRAF